MKSIIKTIFLLAINILQGQITRPFSNNQMFTTPDVSAFQKYNLTDINLYNGKIDLSIPIYEINTGGIKVPISITYNSGGIKVDQISSNVGMGWNLNAGGSIIRNIKDLPDHGVIMGGRIRGGLGEAAIAEIGFLSEASDNSPSGHSSPTVSAHIDSSPDIFTAISPGLHSKFYLTNLNRGNPHDFHFNTSTYNINFIDGSATKGETVTKKSLINTLPANGFLESEVLGYFVTSWKGYHPNDYEKFELTNTNGILYKYGSPDLYESVPSYTGDINYWLEDGSLQTNLAYLKATASGQYRERVSAWNIDEIEDPLTNRKVNFQYQKYNKPEKRETRTASNTALLENAMPFIGGPTNYPRLDVCAYGFMSDYIPTEQRPNPADECLVKNSFIYTKYPQNNRIESIKWDNGEVKFYYDLVRQDATDEKALTRIEVVLNNKLIDTYFLNYSYFNSKENCSEWQCKRLKLDYINVLSAEDTQQKRYYTFDYYYDHPLPKVNSLQQDFLGYYNNHGVEQEPINMHVHPQVQKSPTVYYSGGNVSPFAGEGIVIPGDYSLESNDYSLTGLLKKVTNPLGGFNEYEYELNEFSDGTEYNWKSKKGGGIRIKTQIINDGKKERYISYEYKLNNNQSSGILIGKPVYGYPLGYDHARRSEGNNVSFVVYTNDKGNVELTNDGYVGYRRVIEREVGKGYKEYIFSYEPNIYLEEIAEGAFYNYCYNFLFNQSSFGKSNFINRDILRGKLLTENLFDNFGNALRQTEYKYRNDLLQEISIPYQTTLTQPLGIISYPGPDFVSLVSVYKYTNKLRFERNVLVEKIDKEFIKGVEVETRKEVIYDNVYPMVKKEKFTFPDHSISEVNYLYPHDFGNQLLIGANMLSVPLSSETKSILNGVTKTIAKQETIYSKNVDTSNLIQPTSVLKTNLDNSQSSELTYDKYDNKGNLLQFTMKDGLSTVVLWGYKQSLPIAKIEGATYAQVMQKFGLSTTDLKSYLDLDIVKKSDLDIDSSSENNLITSLKGFRDTLHSTERVITTYTHNPGIGITSIQEPNGLISFYKYNKENKLESILNNDHQIIKEFTYNRTPEKQQTIFYNRRQEQTFTRNDCPSGYSGGDYTYAVEAGKHSSTISLADANQKAINELQQTGQALANANATCTNTQCPYTPESYMNSVTSSVNRISNTRVRAIITIPMSSNLNFAGGVIGAIEGSCQLKQGVNTVYTTENGREWNILMSSNGKLFLQLQSGVLNSTSVINLDFEYDVNDQGGLKQSN